LYWFPQHLNVDIKPLKQSCLNEQDWKDLLQCGVHPFFKRFLSNFTLVTDVLLFIAASHLLAVKLYLISPSDP
jgi:hypothetical protein